MSASLARAREATEDNSAEQVLAKAEALAADGRPREAVLYTTEQNRRLRDPKLEWRLAQFRHQAFDLFDAKGRPEWPPVAVDPFPGLQGIPEIAADDLSSDILGGAILHHGCLIVRGLVSNAEAERLKDGIDRAFAACKAARSGRPLQDTLPWYGAFPFDGDLGFARSFAESAGGVLTADSPALLFELIEYFTRSRVLEVIEEHLGERPAMSVRKSTLRRVPFDMGHPGGWHQDGAFLGADIRTVNVWLSLSDCGLDAPGLDVVPRRIPHIVETGTHGSPFSWTVGDGMVDIVSKESPVVSPVFAPGDAMLFDQLFLHRTGVRPEMTRSRWAIETWYFAPSTFPKEQIPLLM